MPSHGDQRKSKLAVGALLACLAILPGCRTSARQLDDATYNAGVDRVLEDQRREQHLPGLAKDDRVIYSRALGLRDIERSLPVTVDTLFPIGSCTKAFTSMAITLAQTEHCCPWRTIPANSSQPSEWQTPRPTLR
jgi:CubicO group peptidase (beta-lactamase class C family)